MRMALAVSMTFLCLAAWALTAQAPAGISSGTFKHHFITADIPQVKPLTWGYGTPVLADFDKDGDLDYAFSTREKMYWFEQRGPDDWQRHEVGDLALGQLGGTGLDVDRDWWIDIVEGGYWYRNPHNPTSEPFDRYRYDSRIRSEIHDIVAADLNGDARPEIIVTGDEEGMFWYEIPADPRTDANWPRTTVTTTVLQKQESIHGGITPRGVADLDNDGDADLVLPDRWYENRSAGTEWVKHPLPFGKRGMYGLSSRSWVVDLDKDGDNDIVATDSDQTDSRAAWLENNGQNPPVFTAHFLPKDAPGIRGSFHSLAVADLDGDADLDIVTVEQEDPDILPSGASPRWYVWENLGGKPLRFAERVVLDVKLGGHDIQIGDIDGDGDVDIASKVWSRWSGNANGGKFHADWLENLTANPSRAKRKTD